MIGFQFRRKHRNTLKIPLQATNSSSIAQLNSTSEIQTIVNLKNMSLSSSAKAKSMKTAISIFRPKPYDGNLLSALWNIKSDIFSISAEAFQCIFYLEFFVCFGWLSLVEASDWNFYERCFQQACILNKDIRNHRC